ncbi:MAG: PaaI family thioesterase [Rhodomicrobiaceae bacterium]
MDRFEPSDPDWEARIRDSFARQPFMTTLGASMTEARPGRVVLEAPFSPRLTQQHGFFHAGVTASLADSAAGYAAYSLFPAGSSVLTVEFKINLVSPARGERLRAVGEVIKQGRTLTVCEIRVFAIAAGKETLCAVGQQTLICLADRPDRPA